MKSIQISVNDGNEDWGELNETVGSRNRRDRVHQSNIRRQQDTQLGTLNQSNHQLADDEFENLLNEAIIQSILEQDRIADQNASASVGIAGDSIQQLDLTENEEEK